MIKVMVLAFMSLSLFADTPDGIPPPDLQVMNLSDEPIGQVPPPVSVAQYIPDMQCYPCLNLSDEPIGQVPPPVN